VLATACSTPHPRTAEVQGSTSRAHQVGPSCCDQHDHAMHGRNVSMALPSCRLSPSKGQHQSNKGKAWQMSLHRSQPARLAEQLGKNSKRRATPEPITAQVSPRVTDQACHVQCILQLFEAGMHSCKHDAGSGNFSISTADILKILTDEFSTNDPEDGRYTPQQHMQGAESSPATAGEFNHMLNAVVHKVRQPRADEETSLAYTRCRTAQE
jgi:hypothetical protein